MDEKEKAHDLGVNIRRRFINGVIVLLENDVDEKVIGAVLAGCLKQGIEEHAKKHLLDTLLDGKHPKKEEKPKPESQFAVELAKALK